MFLWLPRMRTVLALVVLAFIGMALLHPGDAAAAAPGDPTPTTTDEMAALDPVWADLGINTVGADIPEAWRSGAGSFWDTPPSTGTPGELAPGFSGRAQALVSIRHTFGGADISSVTIDQSSWKVSGFKAGVVAPAPDPANCDPNDAQCIIAATPGGNHGGVQISVDPIMWLAVQFAHGAQSIFGWVLSDAAAATTPDLSAAWFAEAWAKSYGLGAVIALFVLAIRFGQGVRKSETGQEWLQDIGIGVLGFFLAGALGPVIGQLGINGMSALGDNIVSGGGGVVAGMQSIIDTLLRTSSGDGSAIGGSIVALLLFILSFVASVSCFVVLIATTAIIYLSAALFMISFAWFVHNRYRAGSTKLIRVFAIMLAAKPLMFIIISVAVGIIGGSVTGTGSVPRDVILLVIGSFIMLIAGGAPVLAWNFLGEKSGSDNGAPGGNMNVLVLTKMGTAGSKALRGRR